MNTARLELYHNHMSTCSAKVRLVLAEKKLPWDGHLLDLRAGDNLRPEYLKLNRNGVVPTDAPFFVPAVKRMTKLLDDMEATLGRTDWLAGATYSLADAAMTPYVVRLGHLGFDFLLETRPRLAAWLGRATERPSFDEAMVRWYEPSYMALFARVAPQVRDRLKALTH